MAQFLMQNNTARRLADGRVIGAGDTIDIEKNFEGLHYLSCKGLLDKGKRKNVYTEEYADSDRLRVWQGDSITREATVVEFEFAFVGESRAQAYSDFYTYVCQGKLVYWDDVRKKKAEFILIDALAPSEDIFVGSTPYIKSTFTFQNLKGECEDAESI